jgi:hypothetical protein
MYAVSKELVSYIPILLGVFMFLSACVGYGKPPVKWHIRVLVGAMECLLLILGIRLLHVSK